MVSAANNTNNMNLTYSTYHGGNKADQGTAVAVDNQGNTYITGYTNSSNFNTSDAYQNTYGGGIYDAFLSKFDSNGTLIYSTYLGGDSSDFGYAIAVDNNRNVYITGQTMSTNFPTTSDAYQQNYISGSGANVFLSKFNSTGNLIYSTYLGGTSSDYGKGIAVDSNGNIYITGYTQSSNFPTINAYQPTFNGTSDVFLSKFSSNGTLIYSTYLGGNKADQGTGIAVDNNGNIYITGQTQSPNFPTTSDAYQQSQSGTTYDVFLSEFNSNGNLNYSTYLGGTGAEYGNGIAVDSNGNIYITGYTTSTNFPITSDAYQTTSGGDSDVFLSKFSSNGNLTYSTYLGGNSADRGNGIGVDNNGNIYITGYTTSTNFPITSDAYQTTSGGDSDVFLSKFSSNGNLTYSTYLGGNSADRGNGIAVDNQGNIYATGYTGSNFPTTPGAYQTTYGGGTYDAFLVEFSPIAVAGFTATPTNGTAPLAVNFTDASAGYPTSWSWSYSLTGADNWTEFSNIQNPSYIFTSAGVYDIQLNVTNSIGSDSIVETGYITVNNQAPILNPIGNKTVNENTNLNFTVTGTDPDGDNITYNATNLPSGATFNDGVFNWTPDYNQAGTYQVTFTVSDGNLTDDETITITVNDVNRPPTLNPIGNKTVNENTNLNFTVTGTDPDGDNITYNATNLPSGATFNDGVFNWTPDYNQAGTYQVTFTVSDGNLTDEETITITVNDVNRAPTLNPIGDKTTDENLNLNFTVTGTDPDDDPLTYSATNLPTGATFTNDGVFNWTPTYNQSGTYTLTFTVSDGNLTSTETITITVNDVDNVAPSVISVDPANNKVIKVANKALVITFSENIKAGSAFTSIKVTNPDGVKVKPLYKVINGKTLTLTRNGYYINGLTYTITLPTGSITDTAGNTLTAYTSKFKMDFVKPTVTSVNPTNNKVINVANKALVITFSENIKAGSAFTSIKVTNPDGVKVKPLYKVINGKKLTLTRNGNYINGLTYTITLPTNSITDTAGNTITAFTSKFKIDTTRPKITNTNPKNRATKVARNKNIKITFNENIKASKTYWIELVASNGSKITIKKSIKGKVLTLTHTTKLKANTKYKLTLYTGAITDTAGNPVAAKTITFTTGNT
jgi:PKD repeat protein/methionine-rich copper-binding protein CopC